MRLYFCFFFCFFVCKPLFQYESAIQSHRGPKKESLVGSLGCAWWNQKLPFCLNTLNMCNKANLSRFHVPMHMPSIIFVVQELVPYPKVVIFPNHVVVDDYFICLFACSVPCNLSTLKDAVPNHMRCFFKSHLLFLKVR